HELGRDRQLGRRQFEGLARDLALDAVELEHDAARLHPADPVFGRALAAAHADFGRLGRYRHVRENPDPDAADAADVASDRAPRRLDLPRGDAARLDRFHAIGAEIERGAAFGHAMDAALMRLAVLGAFGGEHLLFPVAIAVAAAARPPVHSGGLGFRQQLVLRHRVVREDFALEHPDLDAAGAIGGLGRAVAEIDIGAQCVQRHAAFAVPLHAGDLGAAEPARAIDADALGAK